MRPQPNQYLRLISIFLISVLFTLLFTKTTSAKTPEEIAKDHGITFPISELGGCANVSACRTFCDDPTHSQTCSDFAKSKGLNRSASNPNDQRLLATAKTELGCDSPDSCSGFCRKEANYDKCSDFAKKHNLSGGQGADPAQKDFLDKAKQVLGCDSAAACTTFCSKQENHEKCSNFAKQVGLRGGQTQTGPGGCNSEDTCRAYCQQHPGQCGGDRSSGASGSTGPGNHSDLCNQTPNCAWTGSTCQCPQGTPTGSPSNPPPAINPESYCKSKPGCAWTSGTCQCPTNPSPTTNPSVPPPTGSTPISPADYCQKSGCTWTGSTCVCSPVRGAGTTRSLLKTIIQTFLNLL